MASAGFLLHPLVGEPPESFYTDLTPSLLIYKTGIVAPTLENYCKVKPIGGKGHRK